MRAEPGRYNTGKSKGGSFDRRTKERNGMMKKTISMLMVLALLLTLFSGCGSQEATVTTEPKETTEAPTQETTPEIDYANSTVILYTGNVRGNVELYPQIAAAKAAYEAKGATVYLVDAGNYLQGTAAANSDRGLTIYNLMDAAGYDVAGMGVYEFVYGPATTGVMYHGNLTKYYTQAELYRGTEELEYQKNSPRAEEKVMATREAKAPASFTVICSNLEEDPNSTVKYETKFNDFEANTVLGENLKVGFVSCVPEDLADHLQDGFLQDYVLREAARPECDVLVALGGGTGDIVIEAPTDGEQVVGAYVINNETRAITQETVDLSGSDAAVAERINGLETSPVAFRSEVTLDGADRDNRTGRTNLGSLVADALKWYGETYVEDRKDVPLVAIQNGGNCDNFIYPGDVTERDLLWALPFSPMGVGIEYMTGAELLETLEAATQASPCPGWAQVSGLEYIVDESLAYDMGEEYGDFFKANSVNRVTITSVNGEAFDENATYAVIADNFLMNGNDTYYTFGAIKEAGENYVQVTGKDGLLTRDIVALYVTEVLGGTVDSRYAG